MFTIRSADKRGQPSFPLDIAPDWPILDYLTYAAQWYEPAVHHINTYIDDQNQKVTGTVTVRLYKGTITVVSVDSPHSLFDINLATFDSNTAFNQNSSAGFIELYSLSQRTAEGAYSYGK